VTNRSDAELSTEDAVNIRHRALAAQEDDLGLAMSPLSRGLVTLARPRSIRAKLMRILVVSLAMVTLLLGLMVANQVGSFQAASRISRMVTVTLSVQDAVHQLQKERGLTNGYVSGGTQFHGQVLSQRPLTDAALAALNAVIANPANADAGADAVRNALAQLSDLGAVRSAVDNATAAPSPTFSFYTNAISALNLQLGVDQAQDPALRSALQALYTLGDAKEYTGQERGLLNGIFSAGKFTSATYQQFSLIRGEKQAALDNYARFATTDEQNRLNTVLRSPAATQSAGLESVAISANAGAVPQPVDPNAWWSSMTTVINDMRTVQQNIGADATARAGQLREDATRYLMLFSALALLAIAVEIGLVIGAARSVIGPLGALAGDADEVARRRLPDAVDALQTATQLDGSMAAHASRVTVPAHASTEIRRMAAALDRVRQTALALASEQAVIRRNTTLSLANLGRRNQNLVRRQLTLISDFEREELDPSALANMFELDHLATRMRRNAESLLVLVGDVSPRPWSEPLPVSDVIRAALSEVEGYRRVTLRRIDDAYIVGTAVTEIAHMLAELVENGLAFSPPDMEVEIYGRRSGDGYLLAIVDAGVGMTQEAIATANRRLRDEENYLVAPTRFLGHYVVGRLARPLRIEVRLTESPVTGITARLTLPGDLLTNKSTPKPSSPTTERAAERTSVSLSVAAVGEVAWPVVDEMDAQLNGSGRAAAPDHRSARSRPEPVPPLARQMEMPPAPRAPVEQPPSVASSGPVERTKNGLVKRQRKVSGKPPVGQHSLNARRRPVADPALADRTPEEVGSMLSSFHRGHRRGETQGAHALRNPADNPTQNESGD
jgi:signal transduction histidine kinase